MTHNNDHDHHHPTTTFTISNAIEHISELNQRLEHSSFMPTEELLGLCMAGSIMITSMADATTLAQFSEEEISLVESTNEQIESFLLEIYEGTNDYSEFNNDNDEQL